MKIFLSLILIFLSFLLSFLKVSELKRNRDNAKLLYRLSERLKSNLSGEMNSAHKLCEDFFNQERKESPIFFSSFDELVLYINEEFSALPYISEYLNLLSAFPVLSSDELSDYGERLVKTAENGYRDYVCKYKKDSRSVYVAFPGIMAAFLLILL